MESGMTLAPLHGLHVAQSGPDNKLVGPFRARSERWLKLTSKATFLFSLTKCAALLANAQRLIKNE